MCLPCYPCKCTDVQCYIKEINVTSAGRMLEQSGSGFPDIEIGISWRVDWESEIKGL